MPLAEQVVNTPEDIEPIEFAISAVSFTATHATYTAIGHTFIVDDIVIVSDIEPAGYNDTFTITSVSGNTFTVENTTDAVVTVAIGTAYQAPEDVEIEDSDIVYITDSTDVVPVIDLTAREMAEDALDEAVLASAAALAAAFDAGVAQSTANGKNTVTYSTNTASGANSSGDIWWQYSGAPHTVIAQWTGAGGSTWTSSKVDGLTIANIDAGSITTGFLRVAGSMSVTTATQAQISGNPNYARLEMTATGLIAYNGSSATVNIGADGTATFLGSILSGSSVTGATILGGSFETSHYESGSGTGVRIATSGTTGTIKMNADNSTMLTISALTVGSTIEGSAINKLEFLPSGGLSLNNANGALNVASSGTVAITKADTAGFVVRNIIYASGGSASGGSNGDVFLIY